MTVPEEWLEADIKQGITNQQVEERRKKFGWNEIVTEKENLFLKFLGFFTGPVLYGKPNRLSAHRDSCDRNGWNFQHVASRKLRFRAMGALTLPRSKKLRAM